MSVPLLQNRARALAEEMDRPDCDPARLARTYAQFDTINRLFSPWRRLYARELRPHFAQGATRVLDLGCGGGDVVRRLAHDAHRDGFSVTFLGADPDPRAIAFAQAQPTPPGVSFRTVDAAALVAAGEPFDLVLSNHVLHHLDEAELVAFCQASQALAQRQVLHSDLRRSALAYRLFPLTGLLFRDSFIVTDGLRSLQRAYTVAELTALAPPGWSATDDGLFRLQLSWTP